LFFASNALYPVALMPPWLRALSRVNPLTYEVSGLRGLLIGLPTDYWLDFGVLIAAATAGIVSSAALLPRLAR
jgi:ABC-2 type transport system permease protein